MLPMLNSPRFLQVLPPILCAWFALTTLTGCRATHSDQSSDFLKPLTSAAPAPDRSRGDSALDERTLCIQTARAVADRGHADEAIALYQRAEQIDPDAAPLDQELAPLFASTNNHDAAIERYRRLVTRSPSDAGLANNFAWTLMQAGRLDEAAVQAERGLEENDDDTRLRCTLAMILYQRGDRDQSLHHFDKAVGTGAAHHNVAVLDIDAGDMESAKRHLELATQADPSSDQSRTLLRSLAAAVDSSSQRR